jgi:hypothetical protein
MAGVAAGPGRMHYAMQPAILNYVQGSYEGHGELRVTASVVAPQARPIAA